MNILIVCTGNTCRSSMAEVIAKEIVQNLKEQGLLKDDFTISSAGVSALDGHEMSQEGISVLSEINIDGNNHKSRQLTKEMLDNADLIWTMQVKHKEWIARSFDRKEGVYTLNEFADSLGEIKDPYGSDIDVYREIRDEISYQLEKCFDRLK